MTDIVTTEEHGSPLYGGADWSKYMAYRPVYPKSFFKRIHDHHGAKPQASWSRAHDAGAGAGIGYAALGHKILGEELGIPESKLSFLQESAEKSSVTSGTIDLVAACQMLHWTDPDAAVDEFHRQLKPGGTLAITAYTRPRILGNPAAQRAWRGIFAAHAKEIGARGDLYLRALRNGNSAFESVGFPEGKWREVKRVYINSGGTLEAFRIDEWVGESKVGPGEERIWEKGDQDWRDAKGIDWLRGYFSTWIPKPNNFGKSWKPP